MDQPEILYTTLHQHILYLEQDVISVPLTVALLLKRKSLRIVILAFSLAANSVITGFFKFIARNVIQNSATTVCS
jgi:hypothetical protein